MNKYLLLLCIFLSGCFPEGEYREQILFPGVIYIENRTDVAVTVDSIFSIDDGGAAAVYTDNKLLTKPGSRSETKARASLMEALESRRFKIGGQCGENENWIASGDTLEQINVSNEHEWSVTILIDQCE